MSLEFERQPRPPSTRAANLSLGLDAGFCNIVGLTFTLAGAFMADWLGVAGWVATVFGIVVLLWSFVVTLFANRRLTRRRELDLVIGVNAAAIAVFGLAALAPLGLSSAGRWVSAGFALATIGFLVAQVAARPTTS